MGKMNLPQNTVYCLTCPVRPIHPELQRRMGAIGAIPFPLISLLKPHIKDDILRGSPSSPGDPLFSEQLLIVGS